MKVRRILPGIWLIDRDGRQTEALVRDMDREWISMDHCADGYMEWKGSGGDCLGPGDFRIARGDASDWCGNGCPCRYRGTSIRILKTEAEAGLREWFPKMGLSLDPIWERYCRKGKCVVLRDKIFRDFFEIFYVGPGTGEGAGVFFALKTAELIWILSERASVPERVCYYPGYVVEKVRRLKEELCAASGKETDLRILSARAGLSPNMIKGCFRELYGQTIAGYLRNHRLAQAADRLAEGNQSILEIAAFAGYENPGKFSAAFKKRYGLRPSEYRRAHPYSETLEKGPQVWSNSDEMD